ncbi:MAG: ABC transporter ATP-binding protein [Gemmatimonadota bacterium]
MNLAHADPPLRLDGIRKRYGPLEVLKGVRVELHGGRITALLGPNGAGKTTLLKIALGLVRADAGEVIREGQDVRGTSEFRRSIGFMPQLPRFPANLSARELAAMLDDLRDFRDTPDEELFDTFGLAPVLDKPFRALSGGTRQKVNAALAFRYPTPVLILDEPTAGLDPVAARVLKEKIRKVSDAGRAVLLTSHDLGQVQALADEVVFLLDGVVRYEGSLRHLLNSTGQRELEGAVATLMVRDAATSKPGDPCTEEVA